MGLKINSKILLLKRGCKLNFYNKNTEYDKNFLNLYTKLNLAFWIGSDIDSYYSSSKLNISTPEFKNIKREFLETLRNARQLDISELPTSNEQFECLALIKEFLIESLMQLEINNIETFNDSESEDISVLRACESQNNFFKNITNYLCNNEMEFYLQTSYKLFQDATIEMFNLESKSEFQSKEMNQSEYKKIAISFGLPRKEIDKGLQDPMVFNSIMDEYLILNNNKADEDYKEYLRLHITFMKLWKEYYKVLEQSFISSINVEDIGKEDRETESLMFDYEMKNYLALININAIKISIFTLKKLNVEITEHDIYCKRILKSPVSYIQNRLV